MPQGPLRPWVGVLGREARSHGACRTEGQTGQSLQCFCFRCTPCTEQHGTTTPQSSTAPSRLTLEERRGGGGVWAGMHWEGGTPPLQGAQPPGQVPASMAFVTDSNRPQPL